MILSPIFKNIDTNGTLIFAQQFQAKENKSHQSFSGMPQEMEVKSSDTEELIYIVGESSSSLWGAFNDQGKLVIPVQFNSLESGIDQHIIVTSNKRVGIYSPLGNVLIKTEYDAIEPCFESYYIVTDDGKKGLLSKTLKTQLPILYDKLFPISPTEVLALQNNVWNRITMYKHKKIKILPLLFDGSYDFKHLEMYDEKSGNFSARNEDYFLIIKSDRFGVINKKCNITLQPEYEHVSDFFNPKFIEVKNQDTILYFNHQGKLFEGMDMSRNVYDDSSIFTKTIICKKNEKYGVVDLDGNILVPFNFKHIQNIDGKKFVVMK